MEYAEVDVPRAYGFAVLVGHCSRYLVQVSQVMGSPGCQKLSEGYWAEGGMLTTAA